MVHIVISPPTWRTAADDETTFNFNLLKSCDRLRSRYELSKLVFYFVCILLSLFVIELFKINNDQRATGWGQPAEGSVESKSIFPLTRHSPRQHKNQKKAPRTSILQAVFSYQACLELRKSKLNILFSFLLLYQLNINVKNVLNLVFTINRDKSLLNYLIGYFISVYNRHWLFLFNKVFSIFINDLLVFIEIN